MPNSPNQKMKLLYLMKILLEQTDDDHTLTTSDLIRILSEYGITAERKSIYSDMELLRAYGLNIEARKSKTVGYYIGARHFELPELKLLVDAVQSSRFITGKKSRALIKRLSSLTSTHQAAALNRQVVVTEQAKPMNEGVYYNVDAIHEAIGSKRKIEFQYFDYNTNKHRVYRKDGETYCHTPVALCWNDDKYYLICYSPKYDDFVHYRVDRMSSVTICEEAADCFDEKQFSLAGHTKQVFGMFQGAPALAKLRFCNSLVGVVLDKFGADVVLRTDVSHFEITAMVSESPVFLSWIFQFGNKVRILEPPSLRLAMAGLIAEHQEIYVP